MDQRTQSDRIDAERARALAALLDLDPWQPRPGERLRPMWQLGYFLPRPRQADLGRDGHPLDDVPTPPEKGLRRMFAGGRLRLRPGLRVGEEYEARTSVVSTTRKSGRSGRLVFVTTRTEIGDPAAPALVDERDLVYRPAPESAPGAAAVPASVPAADAEPGDTETIVEVDPTYLFRFSALTYNAHRIHYDRDYAREVEGYRGLLVHGPLQALLMAEAAVNSAVGPLGAELPGDLDFDYQLVRPLVEGDGLVVRARAIQDGEVATVVTGGDGVPTARGVLTIKNDDPKI